MEAARIPRTTTEDSVESGVKKLEVARPVGHLALVPVPAGNGEVPRNPYLPQPGEAFNYFYHNHVMAGEFARQHPQEAA